MNLTERLAKQAVLDRIRPAMKIAIDAMNRDPHADEKPVACYLPDPEYCWVHTAWKIAINEGSTTLCLKDWVIEQAGLAETP